MEVVQSLICEKCHKYEAIIKCAGCKKCICLKCKDILSYRRRWTCGHDSVIKFDACEECAQTKEIRKEFKFKFTNKPESEDEDSDDEKEETPPTVVSSVQWENPCSIQ